MQAIHIKQHNESSKIVDIGRKSEAATDDNYDAWLNQMRVEAWIHERVKLIKYKQSIAGRINKMIMEICGK